MFTPQESIGLMNPLAVSGLLIAVTSFSLAVFVLFQRNPRFSARLMIVFQLSVGVWGLGTWLAASTWQAHEALWFWRFAHVGGYLLCVTYFHLAYVLAGITSRAPLSGYLSALVWIALLWDGRGLSEVQWVFGAFYYHKSNPMYLTFFCIWILLAVLAHRRVWIAQQNCSGEEKKRLQLVFWGMLAGFGGGGSTILPAFGVMLPPLGGFLIPIHSVIVAYAIVRHQLLDIVVVVRKSLLYSLLVGLISCTYLIAVLVLERTFQGMLGYETLFSSLIVAFIIAFFFNPVRDRIQHFIDRALFKGTAYELAAQRDQLLFEIRRGDQMKAVATLAAGLAHEIKNPLSSIRTFTEYLEANHADHEFRAKFRKIVGGEVDRINRIVQELLEFAKPQPPKLEPVELSKALDETLELLNNELVKRHVEVQKDYAAPAMVLGDRQKLQQVFLNLVLNSLDAMNGAGRVVASLSLSGPEAVLAIRDNGQGIPREQIGKVFDPFFSTKPHGTGLGLSVVRSIIAEHGGKIAMESAGRQGVTVTIRLPLATDSRLPMRLKKETT